MEEFSFHRGRASNGAPAFSSVRRARVLGGGSRRNHRAPPTMCTRALEITTSPKRTRRSCERAIHATRPSVPVNFPSSHSRRRRRPRRTTRRSMRADRRRERARPLEQRSRREWNAPPPGRERAVPGRPAIDRHRGDGEADESEKKRVQRRGRGRVRTLFARKSAFGCGWDRFGCGKVRRLGTWRRDGSSTSEILNMEAVLSRGCCPKNARRRVHFFRTVFFEAHYTQHVSAETHWGRLLP